VAGETYRFSDYELDIARHLLSRGGEPIHVEPRAFDLLCYLVVHRDRVVPKNELLDEVWGDRFVTEAALTTALRTARLAVGDTGGRQGLIRTVRRRGYQFVAPATVAESKPTAGSLNAPGVDLAAAEGPLGADRQVIRFCGSRPHRPVSWPPSSPTAGSLCSTAATTCSPRPSRPGPSSCPVSMTS
jgi:DNA-binding winged helix-turn-helix (wHTH) protein